MGDWIGLVATVMVFSIPLCAIWAGALKERYKAQQGLLAGNEREQMTRLSRVAESLDQRISTLESILDAEVPDWREEHDRSY